MKNLLALSLALCMVFACTSAFASESLFKKGDANLDGKISTGDATAILRYTVGLRDFSDDALISADFNSDGEINTGDVVSVLRKCSFRVSTSEINSRALTCPLYGIGSASSDWPGYAWLQGLTSRDGGTSLIYNATSREELDMFTDPSLSPIKGAGGDAHDTESGTLRELTERYDEEYFADYDVMFIAVFEPMIAKTAAVTDGFLMDGELTLNVTIYYPEICAQATNQHLLIVEIPKAYAEGASVKLESTSVAYSSEADDWVPIS